MSKEKSAGIVVFREENDSRFFLLLHYPSSRGGDRDYWDFSKGHLERKESEIEAALRELEEETGVSEIRIVSGFREEIKYFFWLGGKRISKTVVYFLGEAASEKVEISSEHIGYLWLSFEDSLRKLTYQNSQEVLKKANLFLKDKSP